MDKLIDLIKTHPEQINALAAVCALAVSFLSILLTVIALWLQRRHNFKSLTPIASIPVGDYEDELSVKLCNAGVGPLIVEQFTTSDGIRVEDDIISWMPEPPESICWTTFTANVNGRCVSPNQEMTIIKLNGDPDDGRFKAFRNEVRRALSKLTVTVKYRDIYDRRMPTKQRDLKWFARHLADPEPRASRGKA